MERIVNQSGMKRELKRGVRRRVGGAAAAGARAGGRVRDMRGCGRGGARRSLPAAALRRRPPPASIPPGPQPPASRDPTRASRTRAARDLHAYRTTPASRAPAALASRTPQGPHTPASHLAPTTITVIASVAGYNRGLRNV